LNIISILPSKPSSFKWSLPFGSSDLLHTFLVTAMRATYLAHLITLM
jgi:hypothetical protein